MGAHNHDATLHVHAKGMRVMFLAMQDRYDEAVDDATLGGQN